MGIQSLHVEGIKFSIQLTFITGNVIERTRKNGDFPELLKK